MTVNLDILKQHRDALLLAEVAAWLHNIGKMDPNFLVMQTGESPDILGIYRITQYSFRRFARPSVLQGNFPYEQQKGVLYFVNQQLREEIEQIDREIGLWCINRPFWAQNGETSPILDFRPGSEFPGWPSQVTA